MTYLLAPWNFSLQPKEFFVSLFVNFNFGCVIFYEKIQVVRFSLGLSLKNFPIQFVNSSILQYHWNSISNISKKNPRKYYCLWSFFPLFVFSLSLFSFFFSLFFGYVQRPRYDGAGSNPTRHLWRSKNRNRRTGFWRCTAARNSSGTRYWKNYLLVLLENYRNISAASIIFQELLKVVSKMYQNQGISTWVLMEKYRSFL